MAEPQYTCVACGAEFSGHKRKYCSTKCRDRHYRKIYKMPADYVAPSRLIKCSVDGCDNKVLCQGLCSKHYARKSKYGALGAREQKCTYCSQTFLAEHQQKYCSVLCNKRAFRLRAGHVSLIEYRKNGCISAKSGPLRVVSCVRCGAGFNTHRPEKIYCSRRCGRAAWAKAAFDDDQSITDARKRHRIKRLLRLLVDRREKLIRLGDKTKKVQEKLSIRALFLARPCVMCGSPLQSRRKFCVGCAPLAKHSTKRVEKAVRKARIRNAGEWEQFDPFKVFDRDGWRCQICGVLTPKHRRGRNLATSPELDHVKPLSKGGHHTMSNCQCVCRKCNGWKSNRVIVGQISLF